jgi:hypothetical protein
MAEKEHTKGKVFYIYFTGTQSKKTRYRLLSNTQADIKQFRNEKVSQHSICFHKDEFYIQSSCDALPLNVNRTERHTIMQTGLDC